MCRDQYYWWESAILLRNLLLVAVVYLGPAFGVYIQAHIVFLIMLASLVLHAYTRPFKEAIIDTMELVSIGESGNHGAMLRCTGWVKNCIESKLLVLGVIDSARVSLIAGAWSILVAAAKITSSVLQYKGGCHVVQTKTAPLTVDALVASCHSDQIQSGVCYSPV